MRRWLAAAIFALILGGSSPAANVAIWRLDCGKFVVNRPEGPLALSDGCYLIRHGTQYMLWDTGLDEGLIGHPDVSPEQTITLNEGLVTQLARLGVTPAQISYVGISHYHGDHLGQIGHFPKAELFIGKADFDVIKTSPDKAKQLAPWVSGTSPTELLVKDRDLFGDRTVTMISTPGHTPGHMSLLVRLPGRAVLLSGDAVHQREQLTSLKPPENGTDLAAAAASIKRLLAVAKTAGATIVIQHDPRDIGILPEPPPRSE